MPRWLRWTFLAMLSWGVWAIMGRLIGNALTGAHSQALSTLGILPVMAAMAWRCKSSVSSGRWRGGLFAFAAGAISCIGNVIYYEALSRGGKAALVVPLTALYPLITILLAMLLLDEKLNLIQAAGACLSLGAICCFNFHGESELGFHSEWLLFVLAPIVFWGTSGFLQKLATRHISSELSTICFLGAFIPFAVFFLLQSPLPAQITAITWGLVLAQGFFLALGSLALLAAFANNGKASIVTPLAALYPVVSVPIALLVFREQVVAWEAVGIVLAVISVVALSYASQAPTRTVVRSTRQPTA